MKYKSSGLINNKEKVSNYLPDKLPKKNLLVAVQTVNNKVHEATDLPC